MPLAETLSNGLRRLERQLEPWGWQAQWLFQATVAWVTVVAVALLLAALDGASFWSAVGGGLVAAVPAVVMGSLAMSLARSLALSERQREALSLDEEAGAVATRRQFLRQAEREWARCMRYGDDGALLLVAPDHLRRIADQHGQRCADWWLHQVATRVGGTLRQSDILARFDGAELAVFLPHTDPLGAVDVAERIRQLVVGMALNWEGQPLALTVSVGVAPVHSQQRSLETLVREAREALEQAKAAGRNCVRAVSARPVHQSAASAARP